MRLRLSIHRHELPPVKILWHVPEEPISISKLLEQVNDVMPLESSGWGIEDYVVQVDGYECVHYLDAKNILKQDDEVCIRALQTQDIRARTASGRHQISANGAHLIDGIAWGRSHYKKPNRPPVNIPPRKRPRLTYEYETILDVPPGHGPPEVLPLLEKLNNVDESEEEDTDFHAESFSSFGSEALPIAGRLRSGKRRKSVSFTEKSPSAAPELAIENVDIPGEVSSATSASRISASGRSGGDGKKFKNPGRLRLCSASNTKDDVRGKSSETAKESESESSSASSSSSSDPSSSDFSAEDSSDSEAEDDSATLSNQSPEKTTEAKPNTQDGSSPRTGHRPQRGRKSQQRPSEVEQKDQTKARDVERHLDEQLLQAKQKQSSPGQGLRATKKRNERRRVSKKIKALQRAGRVSNPQIAAEMQQQGQGESPSRVRKQELLASMSSNDLDVVKPSSQLLTMHNSRLEMKQQSHVKVSCSSSNMANETQRPLTKDADGDVLDHKHAWKDSETQNSVVSGTALSSEPPETQRKRAKLDVASSRRLVFGSLGVKDPKTKAEEERVKAKLAGKAIEGRVKSFTDHTPPHASAESSQMVHGGPNTQNASYAPDAWKDKIHLMAVECCEKGIKLSTPPFPFVQRWDPQQQLNHVAKTKRGTKRKRNNQHYLDDGPEASVRTLEHDSAVLNYDDTPEWFTDVLNDNRTVGSQSLQVIIKSSQTDDLPDLPTDISLLPDLLKEDVKPTAIIAYRQLEVSEATNWQPAFSSHRTALVDAFDQDTNITQLVLAQRDRLSQHIRYDEDGHRIYGKFEMAQEEDDEADLDGDHGRVELAFTDMIEPKLLRSASNLILETRNHESNSAPEITPQTAIIYESNAQDGSPVTALKDDMSHEHLRESTTRESNDFLTTECLEAYSTELQAAQIPSSIYVTTSGEGFGDSSGSAYLGGEVTVHDSQQSDLGIESRALVEAH